MRPQTGSTRRSAILALTCGLVFASGGLCLAQSKVHGPATAAQPGQDQELRVPKTGKRDETAKPGAQKELADTKTTAPLNAPTPASEPFRPYPDMMSVYCYDDPVHDRADLCAQWRAALAAERAAKSSQAANDIARWSLFVSAVGFAALLYTLCLSRQSNVDNRQIGQAQTRCYLSLEAIQLYIDDTDSKPRVMVALRNNGASPALDVTWSATLTYRLPGASTHRVSKSFEATTLRPSIAPNTTLDMTPIALDFALTSNERAGVLQTGESLGVEVAIIVRANDVFKKEVRLSEVFTGWIHDVGIWMELVPAGSKSVRSVTT